MNISGYSSRTRAFIKIQDGCDQFCSYCIIPYARGRIRSRKRENVLNEAAVLAENGYKEIILTGIHIASYGTGSEDGCDLASLIKDIDEIPGIKRIRVSSIEPMTLNARFVERISAAGKLCPHFHLSLQSGCDATLARMNRKYTTSQYAEVVSVIRKTFRGAAITTDIMTGFPGETEAEFEQTLDFVKKIGFADMHIFEYSRRSGTVAASMPDQIPPNIKKERSARLFEAAADARREFILSKLGKTEPILFERETNGDTGLYEGKTESYIPVYAVSDKNISGNIFNVKLQQLYKDGIKGEIIK